jgi:predicted deacetylase
MKSLLFVLGVFITITLIVLIVSRFLTHEEYDDAHPLILGVDHPLIQRSEWIWVIPLYMNDPISNYPEWIRQLKATGKKIGLHGVKHTYNEFGTDLSKEYIKEGVDEFIKAFGFYPTHFKAPKLSMTKHNRQIINDFGMIIMGRLNQLLHRVHHTAENRLSDGRLPGEFR